MINLESFEASFRDFQGTRSSLPAKIIRLRRISQENHVRRMKKAQQRKQLQAAFDASSILTPFNPKKDSSSFFTPFTTPGGKQDIDSESFNTTESNKRSTGILNYGKISPTVEYKVKNKEYHSKFTVLKEMDNVSDGNKGNVKSEQTIGDSHDKKLLRKKSTNKERRKSGNSKSGNGFCSSSSIKVEDSSPSGSQDKLSDLHSKKGKQRNNETFTTLDSTLASTSYNKGRRSASGQEKTAIDSTIESQNGLHPLDSLNKSKNRGSPNCENQNNGTVSQKRRSRISKIPLALSRLTIKDEKSSSLLSDCTPVSGKNSESAASVFFNQGKLLEVSPWKMSPVRHDCPVVEKNTEYQKIPACDTNAIPANNFPESSEKCCSFDRKNQQMSSVSKWLNNIVNSYEVIKKSSGLHILPFVDKYRTLASNETDSHERGNFMESRQLIDDFGTAKEQVQESSETEQSEEYYDTEETDGEPLGNHRDEKEWADTVEDDASTIIIPSDKELEIETHREDMFRELPDYPSTPYNLRYPRCIRNYDDSVLRSDGKEMDEVLRQLKPIRIRKKTYSLTPKGRKNGKTKKNFKGKSQLLRKKDIFQ